MNEKKSQKYFLKVLIIVPSYGILYLAFEEGMKKGIPQKLSY